MRDTKFIIGLIILAILSLAFIYYISPPVSAYYYVQQGDTLYLNETYDISGILAGVPNLAYYGGYDEESGTQFLLNPPSTKQGYWNYTIDPAIFGNRLGKWYKWNGAYESNGNTLAFVVAYKRAFTNLSENITLQNPNQTPIVLPKVPLLPTRHISDYVIAKGNGFSLSVNGSTSVWIFGYREGLYDYRSFNGSVDITPEAINTLSPGKYTILMLTQESGYESIRTIRYNNETGMIDWFDPVGFGINHFDTIGQTPENILNLIQTISPQSHTEYTLMNLEVQLLSISIDRIDSLNALNATGYSQNEGISLQEPGYIDVRGYTNVAPDTIIKVVVDPNFQMNKDMVWKNAIATHAEGEPGGDLREFKVLIPVDKYNMGSGVHFVAAKTSLSDTYVTADFYIYENPSGNFIPNKTIRYISGKYGPEELIPTPTPIIVTQIVTKVVTQIVTVPVTPSNEQVYAQQKVASEKTWWEGAWWLAKGITGSLFLIGGMWYGISIYRRLNE